MRRVLLLLAAMILIGGAGARSADKPESLAKQLNSSVFPLYVQDSPLAPMHFTCTLTMFEKTSSGYRGLTASHCTSDLEDKMARYYVKIGQDFVHATLLTREDESTDVAILGIDTSEKLGTMPLGESDSLEQGEEIVNMAMPLNLGKLYFKGSVVETHIDEPSAWDDDCADDMLFELPAAGGSSGSAIVSPRQHAIVAIVVRIVIPKNGGSVVTVGVPVKKVNELLDLYRKGVTPSQEHENFLDFLFGPPPPHKK